MCHKIMKRTFPVVPYVGTWIEIPHDPITVHHGLGRSLRGNVDRNVFWVSFARRM